MKYESTLLKQDVNLQVQSLLAVPHRVIRSDMILHVHVHERELELSTGDTSERQSFTRTRVNSA